MFDRLYITGDHLRCLFAS